MRNIVDQLQDDYLDAAMRGWLFNTARHNFYKIAGYSVDDLLQEGLLCFYKCRTRYVGQRVAGKRYLPPSAPDKIARKHFQTLVKTTFGNRISDLIKKQSAFAEVHVEEITRVDEGAWSTAEQWEQLLPPEQELASVSMLLKQAPKEIKQLLTLLVQDAIDTGYFAYSRIPGRRRRRIGLSKNAPRETTNQRFARLLGLPPGRDISGEIEQYFLQA